mmetsp:Transcript_1658/g.3595  ORF Transcript_1658/g.3595 Transcript_1658/m.3595 type:complete len:208 (+) Transcript_1658:1031-1654(+)
MDVAVAVGQPHGPVQRQGNWRWSEEVFGHVLKLAVLLYVLLEELVEDVLGKPVGHQLAVVVRVFLLLEFVFEVGQEVVVVRVAEHQLIQVLSPLHTVLRSVGCGSDCADGEGLFRVRLDLALVALDVAPDDAHLTLKACSAALYQRTFCGDADGVDVAARLGVVERIQHHVELTEVPTRESGFHDVAEVGLDACVRAERGHALLGHG